MRAADTVYKITGLPRWQRDWINDHRAINYSGLVQEMLNEVIKKNDPDYYAKFEKAREKRKIRRKDNNDQLLSICY